MQGGGFLTQRRRAAELFRQPLRFMLRLLRELADENAYARHLAIHGLTHSPAEWRRFSESRLGAKFTRAKCC
jgi:hypothetical protein